MGCGGEADAVVGRIMMWVGKWSLGKGREVVQMRRGGEAKDVVVVCKLGSGAEGKAAASWQAVIMVDGVENICRCGIFAIFLEG